MDMTYNLTLKTANWTEIAFKAADGVVHTYTNSTAKYGPCSFSYVSNKAVTTCKCSTKYYSRQDRCTLIARLTEKTSSSSTVNYSIASVVKTAAV